MSNYRTPAPMPPPEPEPEHLVAREAIYAGSAPLNHCPECGSQNSSAYDWKETPKSYTRLPHPVYGRFCSERRRMRYGFLWLKKCTLPGTHAHQRCRQCKSMWITAARVPEVKHK